MPDPISAAAIMGVSGIGSALIGSSAARTASQQQAAAAQAALNQQQQMFQQTQANFAPFIQAGQGAVGTLGGLLGTTGKPADWTPFTQSPDYNWAFQQGQQATQNLLSAKGNLMSGPGLAGLTQFGQGLASQQYGNYVNRLLGLSQIGSGAAGTAGGVTANLAGTMGQTQMGLGQAQASGTVGQANALMAGLGGVSNAAMLPLMMNWLRPGTTSAYTPQTISSYAGSGMGPGQG